MYVTQLTAPTPTDSRSRRNLMPLSKEVKKALRAELSKQLKVLDGLPRTMPYGWSTVELRMAIHTGNSIMYVVEAEVGHGGVVKNSNMRVVYHYGHVCEIVDVPRYGERCPENDNYAPNTSPTGDGAADTQDAGSSGASEPTQGGTEN
jgi:hypothetical protein